MIWATLKAVTAPVRLAAGTFDAHVVAALTGDHAIGPAIYNGPWAITVLGKCSSLWEVPFVAVWFALFVFCAGGRLGLRALPWLIGAIFVSINLTWLRLALCAMSHASYAFWHNTYAGDTIYESIAMIFTIAIAITYSYSSKTRI